MHTPLIIISGPSGVGKTTTTAHLISRIPTLHRTITVTTRAPRQHEIHGVDYFFTSPEIFEELNNAHAFLETNKFGQDWYATPRSMLQFLAKDKPQILLPDINGAQKITSIIPKALCVWLEVPLPLLRSRLQERKTESSKEQDMRIDRAKKEIAAAHKSTLYTHTIDMSDFKKAEDLLEKIITAYLS